uniref:DH domain-containing protein n=1 Tax=Seriola dumerili TaxID=41447 RepID=A0A3B4U652_SERDU
MELSGERPVSLVSTLSSGSSRDSRSLFGSTIALPSSTTPPIPCTGEQGSAQIRHIPALPVVTDTMAPNPKLTYVDRVVMEIIETERMYVKDLRSIVEVSGCQGNADCTQILFSVIVAVFHFLPSIHCEPIIDVIESKSSVFTDKCHCLLSSSSVAALTDCMRSKTLAKFFRDRQAALKRSLPLGSYLLKPVQRILKYHLLLQEIAKHFDPDEEGYEVVQEAIDTMTGVAWYINDMKRKHEHAVRVQVR